jgi:hypothetical protein
MTTTDVRITRPDQYEVLWRFAAGMNLADIAKDTRLRHETVSHFALHMAGLNRQRARQLVHDYTRACQQRAAGVQCTDPPPPVKRAPRVRVVKESRRAITPPAPAFVPPAPPARMAVQDPAPTPPSPVADAAPVAAAPVLPAAVVDELHAAGLPTRVLYACTRCPGRYRHAYRDHGAPKRCPGRLLRVEVRDA